MLRRVVFRRAEERPRGHGAARYGGEEEGVSSGGTRGPVCVTLRVPTPLLGS